TTNRTTAADYESEIRDATALLVKIHRSNFAVSGFTAEASVAELKTVADRRGLPVVHDLGSGLLISLDAFGLTGEPTAREALSAGARSVTVSGDKLPGGPQARLNGGSAALLDRLRKQP